MAREIQHARTRSKIPPPRLLKLGLEMPLDRPRFFQALLEPHPDKLTQDLRVSAEESLLAIDALKMTLGDLQEVRAKLQELVDEIKALPSSDQENQP